MTKRHGLIMALALAGVLLLGGPGLAQQQGGGAGAAGPADNQVCTPGPGGTCVVNPKNPSNQNCPQGVQSQRRRGPKGPGAGGRMNQPNTQTSAPAAGQ